MIGNQVCFTSYKEPRPAWYHLLYAPSYVLDVFIHEISYIKTELPPLLWAEPTIRYSLYWVDVCCLPSRHYQPASPRLQELFEGHNQQTPLKAAQCNLLQFHPPAERRDARTSCRQDQI